MYLMFLMIKGEGVVILGYLGKLIVREATLDESPSFHRIGIIEDSVQ